MLELELPFYRYLGSLIGGNKKPSQQREMATDLSKFLFFSAPPGSPLNIDMSVSMNAIEAFQQELTDRKLGPSGIISKLNVLCFAQKFILHR